jgi:hypothetical protein
MQSAWNHCAPDGLNSLQIGGMSLRVVFSGLGEKWGLVGLEGRRQQDGLNPNWKSNLPKIRGVAT